MKRDTEFFCGDRRAALTKLAGTYFTTSDSTQLLRGLTVKQHDYGGGDKNVNSCYFKLHRRHLLQFVKYLQIFMELNSED